MAVLMLYNDSTKYTAGSIEEDLQMEKKMVAQTVASLVKAKVLTGAEPNERGEYDGSAEFELNLRFTNPKVKVSCFSPSHKHNKYSGGPLQGRDAC